MSRRFVGVIVILAAATVLTGCAAGVTVTGSGSPALIIDDGFLTGDQALIQGTLAVTESGCVGIAGAGGETYPAVWPRGTALLSGPDTAIHVPGVGAVRIGDEVEGAGGYYDVGTTPALDNVAERCDWQGEVIGIRFE